MCGKRLNCWNTMPMRERTASRSVSGSQMSTPSTRICPLSGSSSRLTQRSSVDLPDPDGPITHTTSPWSTWKSMPLSTSLVPKDLCRSRIWIAGAVGSTEMDSADMVTVPSAAGARATPPGGSAAA